MALVMGVDSSTQSTKVEVRDLDSGELVAAGRAGHQATTPPRSEQDPADWWHAFAEAVDQCGAAVADVAAVSVAGQQHGMVVLDAEGEVIRPAKLWNDTESAPEADALVAELGASAWAEACGSVPVAAFTITKLAWLARHEPDAFAAVDRVMLPHDWLTWRLSGEFVTDRGDASGTGWWSPTSECWRLDLLELVDPSVDWASVLPRIAGPFEQVGGVMADLGLPATAVVGPGTGDNMAAALGLGLRPGDVAVSLGTSGTAYAVAADPTADPAGEVAGFADASGHFLPLVCTLNATKVTDAVALLMGIDAAALSELAVGATSDGLVVLPYFDGERTPNRPEATGVVSGLRSDVSREQLARAAHEGVICGLLDGVDALAGAGVGVDGQMYLIGGGARAAAYREVLAALSGRAVQVPDADELVALGACVQAAACVGPGSVEQVAEAWGLGGGTLVEPVAAAGNVRADYAALRQST